MLEGSLWMVSTQGTEVVLGKQTEQDSQAGGTNQWAGFLHGLCFTSWLEVVPAMAPLNGTGEPNESLEVVFDYGIYHINGNPN